MSKTRLHKLTTIYLALVYGVVGLTGGTLHYIVTDWNSFWSTPRVIEGVETKKAAKPQGFYHVHGPDFQPHFHAAIEEAVDPISATVVPENHGDTRNGELKAIRAIHTDHACPLLSFVNALKSGHSLGRVALLPGNASVPTSFERSSLCEFLLAFSSSARGPPLTSIA